MKRFILNLITVLLGAAFLTSAAMADMTIYQSSMASDTRDSRRVGGLCFNTQGTGWPSLIMQGGVVEAGGGSTQGGFIGPFHFMFGKVATSASGSYQSDSANSVSNTLRYGTGAGSDLYITLSRLSPAMLLNTTANEVRLFGPDTQTDIDQIVATAMHFGGIVGNYSHGWWSGTNGVNNLAKKGGAVRPLRWATRNNGQIYTGVLDTQTWPGMNSDYATRATSQAGTPATPPLGDLDTEWLLLWYGADSTFVHSETPHVFPENPYFSWRKPSPLWGVREQAYQADVAILLVSQNAPTNISHNSSDGIVFNFSSGMGKTAVLPLYGHSPLRAADTEQWLVTFPSAVATRCDQWADRLAEFPTNVSESVAYNSSQDEVTFTENVTFTTVRSGGQQQSPLPAMLGLAWHQGLPVTFSASVTDTGLSTVYGQVVTISGNSYTWTIDGLGDYINYTPTIGSSTSESAPLEAELEAEVDKVIAAGPLSPFIFVQRMASGYAHFTNPADGLYLLAELMPALSSTKQTQLTNYLINERSVRPPETMLSTNETGDGPWGAMREPFDIFNCPGKDTSDVFRDKISPPEGHEPTPSLFRAYGLYRYYKITGENPVTDGVITWCENQLPTVLANELWDTFGWYWGKYCWSNNWFKDKIWQQTPRCVNRDMAGLIGYLSLCDLSSQTPDTDAWGRLAKLAVLRYSMTKYGRYQAMAGMVGETQHTATANDLAMWADFSDPNNFVFVPMEINQYNIDLGNGAVCLLRPTFSYIFMDMVPEVGKMLKDWGAGSQVQKYMDRYTKRQANWYAAKADLIDGAEFNLRCIVDPHQMFMAHAWIAGTSASELEQYINVSWMNRGDFYYMHKLAETIKTYRTDSGPDTTPPTPDPLTWASAPAATGSTSISMTATTASDPSGVEYYFDCTAGGGHDSGWQDGTTYQDTGLSPSTQYSYRVQARDKSANQNAGGWSTTQSATTNAADSAPPTPNPLAWATVPYATGSTSISMTATTASDPSGVEYYFDCTAGGGNDSGWQDGTTYEDTGLTPDTQYTYRVQARDKSASQNTGGWSTSESATTDAADSTPPTPDPLTWATLPYATGSTSISMTATTASDPSGVEYYFECTAGGGNDSGWQASPSYTDTGLTPETQYTYRVRARDLSANQNETGWSSEQSATTQSGGTVPLLTHWPLDDGSGAVATDIANGHDANFVSTPVWTTGLMGGGLQFDGVDDYLDAGGGTYYNGPSTWADLVDAITVSAWVKTSVYSTSDNLISKGSEQWYMTAEPAFRCNTTGGSPTAYATTQIDDDKWHHVVGVYDGLKTYIYVDGNQEAAVDAVGTLKVAAHSPLWIASNYNWPARCFEGVMDDVRIYDGALSPQDVNDLYQQGIGGGPDTDPPTPDPLTWATVPFSTGTTSISMTATTASDPSGVEYYFECTAGGGNDSGWQDSTTYEDTGLSPSTQYTYRVQARDKSANQNAGAWSTAESATTDTPADTTPPTPDPLTWASVPASTGTTSISMTATTASDPSGVEYFFDCTAGGGNDSGWQDSTTYEDTGLSPSTQYTYRAQARDKSPAQNAGGWSTSESATTDAPPDTTPPTPDPLTWATAPYATGTTSISMTATTASDPSGVEYYFDCTAGGGNDSGWQDSTTYEDTGLSPDTQYTYRVQARDKSANQNAGGWSTSESATTDAQGQAGPITVVNFSFEQPDLGKIWDWSLIPGWDNDAPTGGPGSGNHNTGVEEPSFGAYDGTYAAFVEGGDEFYQEFDHTIVQGGTYTVKFRACDSYNGGAISAKLYYDDGGGRTTIQETATSLAYRSWNEYTVQFTAQTGQPYLGYDLGVSFSNTSSIGTWLNVDNVIADYNEPAQQDTTAPTPDPLTWATAPYSTGTTSIAMVATIATDDGGVEYYFDCTAGAGGHDSGWQDGTTYEDTGLSPSTQYTYRVQARDKSTNQNTGGWSTSESATTDAPPDTTPPTPDPLTWASVPASTGTTSISMTATTASDPSGVEYYFDCTAGGGNDSGWQDSTTYEDTGLSPSTQYTYRVQARDKSTNQNAGAWSTSESATTDTPPDTTPPTPDPLTWATVPYSTGTTSISMTATTASDPSGVEYFFDCTAGGGNDSGWQDSTTYEDTGLSPSTQYTYRVQARDKSTNQNAGGWSTSESATTDTPPDTTPPTPDPLTWATVPYSTGTTSISMTATTASDPSGVEYYFDCTAGGGNDSGWQDSTTYEDTGLSPSTQYTYRVQARDKSTNQNAGGWSTSESATTDTPPDTTPPTPDPLTWATLPHSTGTTSIAMTATTASDPSGVEYYFDCTAGGGNDSGWQDSATYEDTGLTPDTQYTYRVQARDKSTNQNAGAWSTSESATTDAVSGWTQLTYDDFESGWGNYTDGGGDCSLYTGGTYAHQGNNAADIQDNSGVASSFYLTNGIDVTSYTQIKVEFWYYPVGMESGEDFWVQYYDGSNWQTIKTYVSGTDFSNGTFYEVKDTDILIDSGTYNFPTDMQVRFMCDAGNNQDDIYIDEVRISAQGGAAPDTTPPTPDPLTWATVPYSTGTTSISMTATTASDTSGVEYYFECTAGGGNDSAWQAGTTYEDTGLTPDTQYTYRVKARDLSTNQNETAWSTSESATTDSGPDPNLVGWWKLDDAGAIATDSSDSDNDGDLVNSPTWTTGQIDGALSFDGVDDYVDITTENQITDLPTGDFSVTWWQNWDPDPNENSDTVLGKFGHNGTASAGWQIYIKPNERNLRCQIMYDGTDGYTTAANNSIPADQWAHIAFVFDSTSHTGQVYVNGAPVSVNHSGGVGNYKTDATIKTQLGRAVWAGFPYRGSLDDVRFYDYALTANDVNDLYQEGLGTE